jgi:hypothetical protein
MIKFPEKETYPEAARDGGLSVGWPDAAQAPGPTGTWGNVQNTEVMQYIPLYTNTHQYGML